ncbi:MAG: PAS domain-containing protein [Myxococcales bacterium]|nr:PAS domain-containing protein [Myxococcales bacterium]
MAKSADEAPELLDAVTSGRPFLRVAPDGRVRAATPALTATLGVEASALLGQPVWALSRSREGRGGTSSERQWRAALATPFADPVLDVYDADGRVRHCRVEVYPVRDDSGRVLELLVRLMDVTQGINDRRLGLMDAISRTHCVMELDRDGLIVACNARMATTLGYDARELVGKPHSAIVGDDGEAASPWDRFWPALRSGLPQCGRARRVGKDGRVVWLQATYSPITDARGAISGVVKDAVDITATMAAEAAEAARVMHASRTLTDSSKQLADIARELETSSSAVMAPVGVAEATSAGLARSAASVAAAAGQTAATVHDIARHANEAAEVAVAASRVVTEARGVVDRLRAHSSTIDASIRTISTIARETNLVALNASIEAARGGELGRGFGVVASEVKALSRHVAEATEALKSDVAAVQRDTADATSALESIGGVLDHVCALQLAIAEAVAEQATTNTEVARLANEAAAGSTSIEALLEHFAASARGTNVTSARTLEAADELATLARELRALLEKRAPAEL